MIHILIKDHTIGISYKTYFKFLSNLTEKNKNLKILFKTGHIFSKPTHCTFKDKYFYKTAINEICNGKNYSHYGNDEYELPNFKPYDNLEQWIKIKQIATKNVTEKEKKYYYLTITSIVEYSIEKNSPQYILKFYNKNNKKIDEIEIRTTSSILSYSTMKDRDNMCKILNKKIKQYINNGELLTNNVLNLKNKINNLNERIEKYICKICYEYDIEYIIDCGHTYCKNCIRKIKENNQKKCYFCRKTIEMKDIKKIFYS